MKPTDNLRRQHRALASMAAELERALDAAALARDASEARHLLSRFAGTLEMHAAMEEEALYPRLMADARPEVSATASRLHDEVGPIYAQVGAFVAAWRKAGAIEAGATAFVDGTRAVLGTLRKRIVVEESELYPLADG